MNTKVVVEIKQGATRLEELFYFNAYILQPVFEAVKQNTVSYESDLAYDILNIYQCLEKMSIQDFKNQEVQIYRLGVRKCGTDSESIMKIRGDSLAYIGGVFVLTGYWDEKQNTFTLRLRKEKDG